MSRPGRSLILGIETSCDETAAAVVENGWLVRGARVATQHELHRPYGGVVPELASRAHVDVLTPTLAGAIEASGVDAADLTAIAVGNRPGLVGSLVVGVAAAKAMSWSLGVPLLGVDHVLAHLVAARLREPAKVSGTFVAAAEAPDTPDLPQLGLVVSGGHTSLYAVPDAGSPRVLGSTLDDAVGEAFDKAAKILGLGHPGGPAIERLAAGVTREAADARVRLPRSLLGRGSLDFSFSGLKTALLYAVRGQPEKGPDGKTRFPRSEADLPEAERAALAAAFQFAAVDVIVKKLGRALEALAAEGTPPGAVVLGGGVSANRHLRERVTAWAEARGLPCRLPAPAHCVDNGAMIAAAGHDLLLAGDLADLRLPAVSTGPR
ncbi:tRNA (adenosine(37)-N6)-threonylcarbamoyltransferase complex transferase subunit TsaD [Phycisphaera mikurensis]|uniref:tRNA N6-adenosine threonylcarbamoyltransferase n=1 Tax=Phycisphaera mikurensis (strain NBRC 102666 / KCTC 22515 / FYK2301M01) TaxID=1142394 RepID=I0IDY8_PHYMF|nr:tRNA (adenosine(37)-N6)-threonylcarbamoyltransferase complex transferase subunit TsaD [Phycisphaera mikurensis]MBB6441283.1 N6-L-threonylcarbamoyladenine synthase [Phycisphaera mikurensis]BAM03476.1 putative O-sialoglycoprotein endopeptidase [Phycisphaera mikurensis NBRC 102666]